MMKLRDETETHAFPLDDRLDNLRGAGDLEQQSAIGSLDCRMNNVFAKLFSDSAQACFVTVRILQMKPLSENEKVYESESTHSSITCVILASSDTAFRTMRGSSAQYSCNHQLGSTGEKLVSTRCVGELPTAVKSIRLNELSREGKPKTRTSHLRCWLIRR